MQVDRELADHLDNNNNTFTWSGPSGVLDCTIWTSWRRPNGGGNGAVEGGLDTPLEGLGRASNSHMCVRGSCWDTSISANG
jgi:hypothetical protein